MKLPPKDRPDQSTPEDMVGDLLRMIRGQFCGGISDADWYRSHHQFIKVKVVLWPAAFMNRKGFVLPASRYRSIMIEILQEIKRHGQTGQVRYWPGYLMKCVQDHWSHHWEEYYAEAKSVDNIVTAALLAGKPTALDPTVQALSTAHRVLTARKPARKAVSSRLQMSLFGS